MAGNLCECGCGLTAKNGNRFILGHNLTILRKDPQYIEDRRQQALKQCKDPDFIARLRQNAIDLWKDPYFEALMGAIHSEQWDDPEFRALLGAATSQAASKLWRKKEHKIMISKSHSKRPNSKERWSMESLNKFGIAFLPFEFIEGLVETDQVTSDYKIAIFEDGCYWHGCETCHPLDYRLKNGKLASEVRNRDKRIRNELRRRGWTVISAWEHEIVEDRDIIGKKVSSAMNQTNHILEKTK